MNHPSVLQKKSLLFLLPVACAGLLAACTGSRGSGTESAIAVVDTPEVKTDMSAGNPAEYDMSMASENRQKFYTSDELDSCKKLFKPMIVVGDAHEPVTETVQRIPWKEIMTKGKMSIPVGMDIAALHISYGLSGHDFHPIFRFMYLQPGATNRTLAPTAFSLDQSTLKEELHPDTFEQAYRKDIRIDRFGTKKYSPLIPDDPKHPNNHADPYATWYTFPDDVYNLIAQNSAKDTMLVVSCISEKYPYRAITLLADTPEYRHLLTLHVGDGKTDLLTNTEPEDRQPYRNHAMDLGWMCPPKCPK